VYDGEQYDKKIQS